VRQQAETEETQEVRREAEVEVQIEAIGEEILVGPGEHHGNKTPLSNGRNRTIL